MTRFRGAALAAVIAAGLSAPAAAETFTLTVAAGQNPAALPSLATVRDYFVPEVNRRLEEMGSEHSINFREAYSGSLLRAGAVFQGVSDGLADIGYIPTLFHPDRLALEQVSFQAPFCTDDLDVVTAAMQQLYDTIPAMQQQYAQHGQVRLAGTGVDSYQLMATFPVRTLEDVDGRRVGTAGAALQWLRGVGAVPVSSNMMEYYNSTRTGVYEGFIVMASTMPGMRYPEAAPYINQVGFGAMYAVSLSMNQASLERLPEDVQQVILEVGRDYGTQADAAYMGAADRGYGALPDFEDTEVVEFPDEERQRWAEAMPNIAQEWAAAQDEAGLPGTEVLNGYMAALRDAGVTCARDWDQE